MKLEMDVTGGGAEGVALYTEKLKAERKDAMTMMNCAFLAILQWIKSEWYDVYRKRPCLTKTMPFLWNFHNVREKMQLFLTEWLKNNKKNVTFVGQSITASTRVCVYALM